MNRSNLKAKLDSLIETVRQLAVDEKNNVLLAKQLEEQPQAAAQTELPAFIRREQNAASRLRSVHDSLQQILQEVKTMSYPKHEDLLENLEYCHRMSGELSQQEAINVTTGQTVAADPFLQTGQVFSAFERMENSAHDELREIEKRLALVAREL